MCECMFPDFGDCGCVFYIERFEFWSLNFENGNVGRWLEIYGQVNVGQNITKLVGYRFYLLFFNDLFGCYIHLELEYGTRLRAVIA